MSAASIVWKQLTGPIARATLDTSGVLAARLVIQATTLLVLAKLLGPAGFAALASLIALAVFLGALATFGTHLIVVRELSRDAGRRDTLLPIALGTTALCGAILLLAFLLIYFALLQQLSVGLLTLFCIGTAELLVQPLLTISAAERLAAGSIARSQWLRMLPLPFQLTTAAGLWLASSAEPLAMYAVGHLVAVILALAISLVSQARPWPAPRRWRLLDRRGWGDHSAFALLALTGTGPSELDKTLSARLLPLETAGIYSAASRITGALVVPVTSLMVATLPRLFLESAHRLPQPRLLYWIFGSCLAYGLAAAGALWLLAPLLDSLFGQAFAGLAMTIRWFSFVVPSLCLRLAAVNVLMTTGRPWTRIGIEVTGLAVMVSGALAFTMGGAAHGVVAAVICAETAMAVLGWSWIVSSYARK